MSNITLELPGSTEILWGRKSSLRDEPCLLAILSQRLSARPQSATVDLPLLGHDFLVSRGLYFGKAWEQILLNGKFVSIQENQVSRLCLDWLNVLAQENQIALPRLGKVHDGYLKLALAVIKTAKLFCLPPEAEEAQVVEVEDVPRWVGYLEDLGARSGPARDEMQVSLLPRPRGGHVEPQVLSWFFLLQHNLVWRDRARLWEQFFLDVTEVARRNPTESEVTYFAWGFLSTLRALGIAEFPQPYDKGDGLPRLAAALVRHAKCLCRSEGEETDVYIDFVSHVLTDRLDDIAGLRGWVPHHEAVLSGDLLSFFRSMNSDFSGADRVVFAGLKKAINQVFADSISRGRVTGQPVNCCFGRQGRAARGYKGLVFRVSPIPAPEVPVNSMTLQRDPVTGLQTFKVLTPLTANSSQDESPLF